MTSIPRVGLAVLFLFALQGCEDKACESAETKDKKAGGIACCKDGKPGEGKPDEACCAKKDDELKKCLQAKAKELAAKAGAKGGAAAETPANPKTGDQAGKNAASLEVGDIKVNSVLKKPKLREESA